MTTPTTLVLAKCKNRVQLVEGDFSPNDAGHFFGRDPIIYGSEPWKIIKVLTPNQQVMLRSLSAVMDTRKFQELKEIFDINVD